MQWKDDESEANIFLGSAPASGAAEAAAIPNDKQTIASHLMNEPTPEEIEARKRWFTTYIEALENNSVIQPPIEGVIYRCPCCGFRTLSERGGYEICPVCFWEDDGQDDADADVARGGPNGALSLTKARQNFREFGACDRKSLSHVRKPTVNEM